MATTAQWPTSFVKAPKTTASPPPSSKLPAPSVYIEYGYAMATKQPMAILPNKTGHFVSAGDKVGMAALAGAEFPPKLPDSDVPDLRVWLFDPAGGSLPHHHLHLDAAYRDQDDAKTGAARSG